MIKFFNSFIIFFISLFILASEILFIRIFTCKEWQSYSSLIISLALMGFGISGNIVYFLKKNDKNIYFLRKLFLFLFYISVILGFLLYLLIPFNPFLVSWDLKHIVYFILHFIVLLLPYTIGATVLFLFFIENENYSKNYFVNLLGSAFGGITSILLLNILAPFDSLIFLLFFYGIIIILYLIVNNDFNYYLIILIFFIFIIFIFIMNYFDLLNPSEYKGISYVLKLPDSKIIKKVNNYSGVYHIIKSKYFRNAVGLSYNFNGSISPQIGIFIDGELYSVVITDTNNTDYVKYTSQYFPYFLQEKSKNNCLILFPGGEGIFRAIHAGFNKINIIENKKVILNLFKNDLKYETMDIYNISNVIIYYDDPQSFIFKITNKFDLIDISLVDTYTKSVISSLNENYLYTIETLSNYFTKLTENGILSITRWLKYPPRDEVKIFNTLVEMMRNLKISDYNKKIVMIRSPNTCTICVSKNIINIEKVREFCRKMSFDPVWFNEINHDEIDNNIKLNHKLYYEICSNIINSNLNFIKNYNFDINFNTYNKPYYYSTFKLKTLNLLKQKGLNFIPFSEWGTVILWIILIPIFILSILLIILPLFFINRKEILDKKNNFLFFIYFFILGIAYFFVQIPLIQKFILFLSFPVYSYALVCASILFFSGVGSYISKYFKRKNILIVFLLIILSIILILLFYDILFKNFIFLNVGLKFLLTMIMVGIPAIFMGMPFPVMLEIVNNQDKKLVGWCWGINGFASVISSLLASLMNIYFGFSVTLIVGGILYLMAGFIFYIICKLGARSS